MNNVNIEAEFTLNEQPDIQADFSIKLTPEKVSQLENDLNYQTQEQVQEAIQAESVIINARIDDEVNTLNSAIESEATTRAETDTSLQNGINTLNDDLTLEISNRTSADEVLQGDIDTVSSNLTTEISDRQDADATLQGNINTVAGDLSLEETARINADTTLQGNIDTLSGTVTSNYNTLDGKITDEATARGNADTTLQNNIDTLSGTVISNYNTLDGKISNNKTSIDNHKADKNNPHEVSKSQVGLGNCDNTSDLDKPISTATQTALDGKQNTINDLSEIRTNASNGQSAYNTIQNYGDIVTYDASSFATSIQGEKADTALQPNDDITKLNNNAGYITSASLPTVNNSTITFQKNDITVGDINLNQANNETINFNIPTTASDVNALPDTTTINDLTTTAQQNAIDSGANTTNIGQIATNTSNISSLSTTVTNNYNTLDGRITSEVSTLNTAIGTETTNRQNADNNLQSQIDAIVSSSDVFDIVGTYAELQAYDISTVPVNDIIKVLVDSTHNNAATYYRCVENNNVKSWSYIGAEGAYYTKSESNSLFVDKSTTINGQDLSNNITLTALDVGALPSSTTIGSGILTIQNNGVDVDSFNANATSNKSINIVTPTKTSDLVNDSGFIDNSDLSDFVTQTDLTDGLATKQDTISDLSTIRSNAQNGQSAYTTIQGYGDIVSYNASNFATSAQGSKADTAIQSVNTGSANGTISVDGSDVSVYGLGSAAYTNSTAYATSAQGTKADSAVQSVTTGSTNGTISVDSTDVSVYGLGSAAYTNSSAYATSTQGGKADSAIQTVKVNNTALTPDSSKAVDITVPTKISNLTDDTATYPVDKADTLTGLTSTVSELNILDGVTASASEINILDGATLTTTELNYVDGVTSSIQTQLNAKLTTSDIVSSVSSSSTNSKAVGAKLFYDTCGDIETLINAL